MMGTSIKILKQPVRGVSGKFCAWTCISTTSYLIPAQRQWSKQGCSKEQEKKKVARIDLLDDEQCHFFYGVLKRLEKVNCKVATTGSERS